jgi:membrane protein
MYASLASAMIALLFLYISASIFIYGGEINAAVMRVRRRATDAMMSQVMADHRSA